jgi:hypothetical protein
VIGKRDVGQADDVRFISYTINQWCAHPHDEKQETTLNGLLTNYIEVHSKRRPKNGWD